MTDFRAIPGYTLLSCIYEGPSVSVWRGHRNDDALPVIIKATGGMHAQFLDSTRLKQEYEIARNLPVAGVVRPLDFQETDQGCALVLEETGGTSLWRMIHETPFSIEQALVISVDLAGKLGELHSLNIVHKDFRPSNILINRESLSLFVTGFGIASVVLKNAQDTAAIQRPDGTLAYISPEQTGRMNCRLDWRSDLYTLGVGLYELFSGKLPFPTDDPLALVHAHIARVAQHPSEINPLLPPMIGAIIGKLMAKSPDERYQNAIGLKKDLLLCLEYYRSSGEIPHFPLGRFDISDKFRIPHKLYGRELELNQLLSAFDAVSRGAAKMVTISGFSGIGKSSLVHELQRPIIKRNGYFITGKFDQFNRNIPYSSLIQAFQELMRQALAESSDELNLLKEKILAALGENAQVIVNVIPELVAIIGPQPKAADLPAAESQNRFMALFLKFTQAFASKSRPLCLFLDDLQWADPPSLKFITDLMADTDTRHLLLLGAYRDNEVDPGHILAKTLKSVAAAGVDADALFLAPLNEADTSRLLLETFNCSRDKAVSLAGICIGKTGGNPFFLSQFLRRLYEEGLIAFDSLNGEWQCDIAKIRQAEITDNVVTLMAEKIQFLSARGKSALKLAACVGNTFPLSVLAGISGKPTREMLADIEEGIREGLIIPSGEETTDAPSTPYDDASELIGHFRFLHDRVQQAAYSLLSESERSETHLRAGRLLLMNVVPSEWRKYIFDIVSHLNAGLRLISNPDERLDLARLNFEAGCKARDSGAFDPAYRYFDAMAACLPADSWDSAYALTLDCHLSKAEAAYLCGNYAECYALCDAAFAHVRNLLDRTRICEVVILAKRSEGRNNEAVSCATAILKELGASYPAPLKEHHLLFPILKTKWLLRGKTDEALLSLPPLTDPIKQAIVRVTAKAGSSVYITDQLLAARWILTQIEVTVKFGRSPIMPYAYAVYGILLSGALRDYDAAYRFGKLSRQLASQGSLMEARGKAVLNSGLFAQCWRMSEAETERAIWEAYELSMAEGDPEFAAISLYSVTQTLPWFFGESLPACIGKMDKHAAALKKLRQDRVNQWSAVYRQTVWNCINPETEDPTMLNGEHADEMHILSNFEANGDRVGKALFYVNKLILCSIFQNFDHAASFVDSADAHSQGLAGQLSERQYHLYANLALLALSGKADPFERRRAVRRARNSLKLLRRMESAAAPISHHAPLLLEAEIMRVTNKHRRAADLYDEAIRHARDCRHLYEEALANELCGRFYTALGKVQIGEGYLQRAYSVYRKWGATARLAGMHTLYSEVTFPRIEPMLAAGGTVVSPAATAAREPAHLASEVRHLDLGTVLKATRAISGEIVLSRLLEELLKIVLENAGAQRCMLLLAEEGGLMVEGEISGDQITVLQSAPMESDAGLPRSIINYVMRTRNSIVLDDALREGEFTQDPYLSSGRVRSLLCLPIVNKGDLTGLLYLENNSAPGVFTLDRLEILKVFAAQIATSIENARLYESIEKKVKERTRELQEKSELLNRVNREMAHEIEQRKLLEDELRKLATTDSLTGLLVRRRFFELGEMEISRTKRSHAPLSLLVLDIDHFKSINDNFGHAAGDELLKHFSMIFCDSLRSTDIVCRFGGEEFVAILPETTPEIALDVAQRVRRNIESSPLHFRSTMISCTVSIGLTWLQEDDAKTADLIRRADEALYQAKKTGRNRIVLSPRHPNAAPAEA
ncbi:MAG TPA: diguanylate cyclase [Gallionellaceae bacterium]